MITNHTLVRIADVPRFMRMFSGQGRAIRRAHGCLGAPASLKSGDPDTAAMLRWLGGQSRFSGVP
jgi:hypothetical protein